MSSPFRELASLDRTLQVTPRLAILTVLLGCQQADFNYLLSATGLSRSVMTSANSW